MEQAAKLKYGELPQLEKRLQELEHKDSEPRRVDAEGEDDQGTASARRGSQRLVREAVTDDEIAGIVARWTGIPVTRLMQGEREKLLHLDDVLHERVIGRGRGGATRR